MKIRRGRLVVFFVFLLIIFLFIYPRPTSTTRKVSSNLKSNDDYELMRQQSNTLTLSEILGCKVNCTLLQYRYEQIIPHSSKTPSQLSNLHILPCDDGPYFFDTYDDCREGIGTTIMYHFLPGIESALRVNAKYISSHCMQSSSHSTDFTDFFDLDNGTSCNRESLLYHILMNNLTVVNQYEGIFFSGDVNVNSLDNPRKSVIMFQAARHAAGLKYLLSEISILLTTRRFPLAIQFLRAKYQETFKRQCRSAASLKMNVPRVNLVVHFRWTRIGADDKIYWNNVGTVESNAQGRGIPLSFLIKSIQSMKAMMGNYSSLLDIYFISGISDVSLLSDFTKHFPSTNYLIDWNGTRFSDFAALDYMAHADILIGGVSSFSVLGAALNRDGINLIYGSDSKLSSLDVIYLQESNWESLFLDSFNRLFLGEKRPWVNEYKREAHKYCCNGSSFCRY